MRLVIQGLLREAIRHSENLDLNEALDPDEFFLDRTCVKANIHFPTEIKNMEEIIQGKRYDTATAEKIESSPKEEVPRPAEACDTMLHRAFTGFYEGKSPDAGDLYRTTKGHYFVHEFHSGRIMPITTNEGRGWCEKFGLNDVLRKHFSSDSIQDA